MKRPANTVLLILVALFPTYGHSLSPECSLASTKQDPKAGQVQAPSGTGLLGFQCLNRFEA